MSELTALPPLPIPASTLKRNGKYHDAARLYIHRRITDIGELCKLVGLNAAQRQNLYQVKMKDDWDGFIASLAANTMQSVWGDNVGVGTWAQQESKLIREERDRQLAMLPKLIEERDSVVNKLSTLDPGTKPYSACVTSLRALNSEIEHLSGMTRMYEQAALVQRVAATRGAVGAKPDQQPSEKAAKGTIVQLG